MGNQCQCHETLDDVWPAQLTDGLITLEIIEEIH